MELAGNKAWQHLITKYSVALQAIGSKLHHDFEMTSEKRAHLIGQLEVMEEIVGFVDAAHRAQVKRATDTFNRESRPPKMHVI